MEQFSKKKTSHKTQIISTLLIFGILSNLGILENFSFLNPLAKIQFWLFGYLGYIWLFVIAFLIYRTKGIPDYKDSRFLEKTLGVVIGIFALLVLQGLFFDDAGILGVAFNSVLTPIITHLGVFILVLFCFGFSVILYSGKSPKELTHILLKDLKEDLKQSKIPEKKIIKNKESIKKLGLSLKNFFALPNKQDYKNPNSKESGQEKIQKIQPQNRIQESASYNSPILPFAKTPSTPRALTLEELIEQSKNNPPPNQITFNLKDNTTDSGEELEDSTQKIPENEIYRNFNNQETFESKIDELRQDIELPTREDNPLENISQKQNPASQIRIVSPQEERQKSFDILQFQLESRANLENFKHFEQNYLYPNKESQEETIRLIKKEEWELEKTAQNPQEVKLNDLPTNQESQAPQDSTTIPPKKPKPIKAYPKNLYAATPFSAYYDKEPVGTHDCLVQDNPKNVDYPQDLLKTKEVQNNEPSTIFYYGNLKSTHPIQSQEIQQMTQEAMQASESQGENIEKNPNDNPSSKAESPTLNHIIRQVIQEFMESQPKSSIQDSNETWEEVKKGEIQTSNTESLVNLEKPNEIKEESAEIQEMEIPYIQPFTANNIPSYGYTFEKLENRANATQSPNHYQANPISEAPISPILQDSKDLQQKKPTSEVISLFDNPKRNMAKDSQDINTKPINIESQNSVESTQNIESLKNVESCVPLADKNPLESLPKVNTIESKDSHLTHTLEIANKPQIAESKGFILPKLDFLQAPKEKHIEIDEGEIDRKINDLLSKLRMFKIEGDIVRTYSGPIVTTFEFRPSPNVKVSRILTLQDDLAMALRAKTIRIQAPVPGKDVVGIEIPNNQIETIYLREILENELFTNSASPLTLALGKDIVGNPFITDLKKLPHLLIAGTTGSGKSVGINAMILSLLYKNSPKQLKLIMIDPKMLEFSIYNEIPHLLTPVITQPKKAIIALDNTVKEMERRYTLMSEARIKNIEGYNQKAEIENFEPFPYIVVVIDELADLMMSGGKEAEVSISRLAQMARASGIHLIVATQRPSVDVVTGLIKANLPSRISYKVGQKIDSKVILDSFGAESLLGRGDMLFTPPGGGIIRLHAPWSTEAEIEKIVEFIKSQCPPQYDENFMPSEDEVLGLHTEGETDELYEEAKRIILNDGKTSISYIQRRLGIGYNKAANIIEQMQVRGFLSEPNSKGVREILGN